MKFWKKAVTAVLCASMLCGTAAVMPATMVNATDSLESSYEWGALKIGGGGFVSGIVTGKKVMYARTDVGGAYRYNYDTDSWEQLFGFLTDAERGYLSVDAMAIDPTDDNTVYFLCGCAYFSGAGTRIYKTTDGGKTFTYVDVTDMIQVHGNGNGRQTGESIAIDPDNPDTLYCGGDVTAGDSCLIKSTDGGKTWNSVKSYDELGLYKETINWPTWDEHPARALTNGEYATQNGVSTICIYDGKVYVGTSTTGENSVVVADVKDDKFTDLSSVLDSANYPSRITSDGKGNLYFTYQGTVVVGAGGSKGGIYKYDTKTGTAKDISPVAGGFSEAHIDVNNPDHIITSTCGLWYSQMWQAWTEEQGPAWGDRFFKSDNGGETWTEITPGNELSYGGPLMANYLEANGYEWIRNKAIHWVGSIVIDPMNGDRIHITSGNGVFSCDDTWSECPTIYFHPDGIEEVVALDFASTSDGLDLSAIGDYDGFVHETPDKIGLQYQPNMGSTSAIAVCPQNTDVWARIAEGDNGSGYYTTDRGKTWNAFSAATKGGKLAIAQIDKDTYRIFNTGKDDGGVSYSDDWGETWSKCEGIPSQYGSKPTMLLVEPNDPNTVYAYATYYNSSWFYSKPAPDASDAQYKFCVSTDGGKTFTSTDVCMYDQCDSAGRIAYLGEGNLILGGGWYGMYHATIKDGKATIEKLENVNYCKTVGYGAPEKEGGLNTVYMYGKPAADDKEGIYRSTDGGATWVCINTEHIYGGTGNGNFLVGDMDEFGKVYMSTVGCGIVYGHTAGSAPVEQPTEEKPTEEQPTETTPKDEEVVYGDVDGNGEVDIADVLTFNQHLLGLNVTINSKNADVDKNGKVNDTDALNILKSLVDLVTLPVTE
ncbi:MAG: dockerin type I domain-containing protein [Oscillospiraceae bacterium]